ncbi:MULTISPECIES: extracellular solute-binding protein [Paenibacillus]|uniref:ABC transporter substrate-binding protein n=1 Tax=Paenibacillus naphthalenovorans TaxID=162209 RepID=A0A0U2UCP3_9BACL|nr:MULTISPECIES: extracellular solute-binding protein [Paenibacillus]ALS24024.1 ABC transporter substrate-binding protein [Paenibacillus naphthalenovorans]GCL72253.1 ABC transporter substrate-binding protein [Paenibacillus naphthalenovorans]
MVKWNQVRSILLAGAVSSISLLSACGGTSGGTASPSAPASDAASPQASDKPVTISFLHWRGEDVKSFNGIIEQFQKEYPNIKVEMQTMPSDQYQSTAQAKLADGSVGDVFTSFPGAQFQALSKAGIFKDLTGEKFLENFNEPLIQVGKKDGKQLAIPYQLVYNDPIYNVKLFEKYNLTPPKDWEGFLALCEKLKSNGIIPIAFAGADIGPGQLMNTMVMNNGPADIFTKVEAGEAKLTDEFWVKTLTQFKELNDKGYFQPNALGTKDAAAGALFIQEKAAILASGSYQLAQNKQQNPNLVQKLLAPITVTADKAVYEGVHTSTFLLAVNNKSKHPEEAKKFIEFLSRKDIAGQYANETGQNVTVKDVQYTTDELKAAAEWANKKTLFQPRFTITNAENQKAVTNSIQAVLSGKSPEDAAKEAQAIVDQQLKK